MGLFLPDMDALVQQGGGLAASLIGQTYDVRRLDDNLTALTPLSAILATSTLTVATAIVALCAGGTAIGWIRRLRLDSQPQKAAT